MYIIYTFINIHIFKSKRHFSEHFWRAVVTVYFSTSWMFPSILLDFTIKGNTASSNFGKDYPFKNDYISRKKSQISKPN